MDTNLSHHDPIGLFERQCLQLVPLRDLRWPSSKSLLPVAIQDRIYEQIFTRKIKGHALPEGYQVSVLKRLVGRIEAAIIDPEYDELSDSLASHLATLLSTPRQREHEAASQRALVSYFFTAFPSCPVQIFLLESRAIISSSGTTGVRTWEAALHLCSFLCSKEGQGIVRGRRVLELGAGTGIVSILCAKYLEAHVLATDGSIDVIRALEKNGALNETTIECRTLRWGDELDAKEYPQADVLLGADITYDSTLFPALLDTMHRLFRVNSGLICLISATIRNKATFAQFLSQCMQAKLRVSEVSFPMAAWIEQRGPFYPTATPVQIMCVSASERSPC